MLALTVSAYLAGNWLYQKFNRTPFLHPVLIAMLLVMALLQMGKIEYGVYFSQNAILVALLGPSVVALAVPIHEHLARARKSLPALLVSVLVCGTLIIVSTLLLMQVLGVDRALITASVTRSVTAPIALAINGPAGINAGLTMLGIFLTGIIGVMVSPLVFRLLDIQDEAVQGFTLGLTAHTFGVARALEISTQAAAFATLGMGLTGCAAALILPILFTFSKTWLPLA